MSLSDGSSTALAAAPGTSLVKSSVPPGVRIKWFQRKETIWVDIEAPDIDIEELAWDDDGTVQITAKNPQQCVTLQLLHRIPQLREISLREDHPFGGCRQALERGVLLESACRPLARRLLSEQQIHLRMDRV